MENTLHVQYDLANLPHCMQCILQIDHWYSWKQSKIRIYFLTVFFCQIEIYTSTMQQSPKNASNVLHPWQQKNMQLISDWSGVKLEMKESHNSKSYFWRTLYLFCLHSSWLHPAYIYLYLFCEIKLWKIFSFNSSPIYLAFPTELWHKSQSRQPRNVCQKPANIFFTRPLSQKSLTLITPCMPIHRTEKLLATFCFFTQPFDTGVIAVNRAMYANWQNS